MAAVEAATRASMIMEEAAPAGTGGGGQRPAVVCLGSWQVAAAEAMSMTEATSAMAEAVSVKWWWRQRRLWPGGGGGAVRAAWLGRHGRHRRARADHFFDV